MLSILTSSIRHVITLAIGGYVAEGFVTGDQVEMLVNGVVGVVTVAGVVVWSIIEKKYLAK